MTPILGPATGLTEPEVASGVPTETGEQQCPVTRTLCECVGSTNARPQDSPAGSATTVFLTEIGKDFLQLKGALDDPLLCFVLSFKFQTKMKIQFQRQATEVSWH